MEFNFLAVLLITYVFNLLRQLLIVELYKIIKSDELFLKIKFTLNLTLNAKFLKQLLLQKLA